MKRLLLPAFIVFASLGLTATASQALEPGCNPDVMTLIHHQAEAVRVRNRAYEREIISRNQSTLWLTCFDQSMRLSARLGYIFSDNVPASPPVQNTFAFTEPLAYPFWGANTVLAKAMDSVMSQMLNNQMKNFPPTPVVPNALTAFVTTLNATFTAINAYQVSEKTPLANSVMKLYKEIDAMIDALPTAGNVTTAVNAINAKIATLNKNITIIQNRRTNILTPLLNTLKTRIMGNATALNCTRMDDLWTDGNPASQFAPVAGEYITGTPYYSLQQFLVGPRPGAGAVFLQELANPADAPILNAAWADLTGPLSAPGASPMWPAAPPNLTGFTTADIINQM